MKLNRSLRQAVNSLRKKWSIDVESATIYQQYEGVLITDIHFVNEIVDNIANSIEM